MLKITLILEIKIEQQQMLYFSIARLPILNADEHLQTITRPYQKVVLLVEARSSYLQVTGSAPFIFMSLQLIWLHLSFFRCGTILRATSI